MYVKIKYLHRIMASRKKQKFALFNVSQPVPWYPQEYGHTPEEAVAFMEDKRPHIWLGSKQWQALRDYHKDVILKGRNSGTS